MYVLPVATYRLQFNEHFRFVDATALVPYLKRLGISHLYASPVLKSRPGSTHGYDVADPEVLDPEIGTDEEFAALTDALGEAGMSLLLDIVPNHMAADVENPWWRDVLERGRESEYARYFDIDWEAYGGKVVLPVLGGTVDEAIAEGQLRLERENGTARLCYAETALPVAEGTYTGSESVREVLDRQHYRLEYWRVGQEELNYRRFFDITDLVSLREEDPEVFYRAHQKVLELVRDGDVTGLRIDHIDGLRDPKEYLDRLQREAQRAIGREGDEFYVVVEKILGAGEELPDDWRCAGTTGYDTLNTLNGLFVDERGLARLTEAYERFTGEPARYAEVAYEAKKQVMRELFEGEMQVLARQLLRLAREDPEARDIDSPQLAQALLEVTAALPVYRTYTRTYEVSRRDRAYITQALRAGRRRAPGVDPAAFDFAGRVLTLDSPDRREGWLAFVMRWQQFTGPITAKGVEDTAFYRYNRLLSMNEVGGEPEQAVLTPERFHETMARVAEQRPHTQNTTSTHDTKRSEDVRARLNVLSEMPDAWAGSVSRWREANARYRKRLNGDTAPDANEEYALYQTMLGAWPFDDGAVEGLRERLHGVAEKMLREEKTHTSWTNVNEEHEAAVHAFIDGVLADAGFRAEMRELQEVIAVPGALNSLSQVVLKAAMPGVPDFYRGTELWEYSLVDPDNRRPVDFEARRRALDAVLGAEPGELLARWRDGRVKLFVTAKVLALRSADPALFAEGEYVPLPTTGEHADSVVAFARRLGDAWAVVATPRLAAAVCADGWPLGDAWGDTTLALRDGAPAEWRDAFTGETVTARGGVLDLRDVFRRFPVAALTAAG